MSEKARNSALRAASLLLAGMMVTVIFESGLLRKLICVAKRVHSVDAMGKRMPVRASRREDFPEDWSPTTTIYSVGTNGWNGKQRLSLFIYCN